jgi:DNA-binding beta-propeller fold protein YncE
MPFVPAAPPTPLAVAGPFTALTIDAPRRRVFVAGARSLAVVDADTGKLLATVRIGGALSLAVEPLGGHVFVGTRDGRITEVDPDRKSLVRSVAAGGPVDLLLYDAASGRLYAGDGGAELATFDARSFLAVGSVTLPGRPAGAAADPVTADIYVGLADRPAVAVVVPREGSVRATWPLTPGTDPAAVRFDDAFGEVVVVSTGGTVSVYDRAGTPIGNVDIPGGADGCDLDTGDHLLACTGSGGLTFVRLEPGAAPRVEGGIPETGARVVLDVQTHDAVVVTSGAGGRSAAVGRIETAPSAP